MNIPIKVRAWDEVNKYMVYDFRTFTDKKIVTDEHRWSWSLKTRNNNQIVAILNRYDFLTGSHATHEHAQMPLMQYTGLKDKNSVEIYEGDVVDRTHLFNGGYGDTHTGEVVYDKEYARYVISGPRKHIEPKTEDLRNTLSDKSTYEVIGNIYENPELLKEQNK